MGKNNVTLVAFYNKKALGVRYLETALVGAGYGVRNVFYKDFNSIRPKKTGPAELELLRRDIEERQPLFIGLSVMCSMYIESINKVLEMLRENFTIPIVCGGAFATMDPEYFFKRGASFVIRSEGERAIVRLADALRDGTGYEDIPSLCYMKDGEMVVNEIGDLTNEIDEYGLPAIECSDACYIDDDKLVPGDPQLDTLSYEVIASRGCPFTCTYCACPNLYRLLPDGIHRFRTRSVKSVIDELIEAKKKCKHIVFMHFYDEVFPNLPGWVDEFVVEYKKHINLPFTIWTHPKFTNPEVLSKLVKVGLNEVIMGIQSGSDHIRKEIFHRYETREEIIQATKYIHDSGVFWVSYDFMLQHPFESIEDLKESYRLVKDMYEPFELQMHGLNFLPGTDIIPMAIEAGYYTQEEMDAVVNGSIEQQYRDFKPKSNSRESDVWYGMMYCLQYKDLRKEVVKYEDDPMAHTDVLDKLYAKAKRRERPRYLYKKGVTVLKRWRCKLFG